MGMDILRCKTPEMIHKELTSHLIACNLVRLTMLEAGQNHNGPVERISFNGALSTLRSWAPIFAKSHPHARNTLWTRLLAYLAEDPVPHGPDRVFDWAGYYGAKLIGQTTRVCVSLNTSAPEHGGQQQDLDPRLPHPRLPRVLSLDS